MTAQENKIYRNVYENEKQNGLRQNPLHPGGLQLTAKNIKAANLPAHAKILDIGCGCGQTVKFLRDNLELMSFGIDPEPKAISNALNEDSTLELQVASAENLPFDDGAFDAVLAECVFCLLQDKTQALAEISRVLKPNGKLLLSDLYLSQPSNQDINLSAITCLQNLLTADEIKTQLKQNGFTNQVWQDCKDDYLSFLAEMIFSFDDIHSFWECLFGANTVSEVQQNPCPAKISYYAAVWQKSNK